MAYRHARRSRWSSVDSDDEFYASECVREALEKAKRYAESDEPRIELQEKLQQYMKDVENNPEDEQRQMENVYHDLQSMPGLSEYIINQVRDANIQALGTPEVEAPVNRHQYILSKEPRQDGDSDINEAEIDRIRLEYVRPRRVEDLRYNNNNNYEASETSVTSVNEDEPYYVVREVIELDDGVSDVSDIEECPNIIDQYDRYARRQDYLFRSVEDLPTYSPRDCPLGPSHSDTYVLSPSKHHRSSADYQRYMTAVPEWLEGRSLRPSNLERHGESDGEMSTKEKLDSFFTIEKLKAEIVRLQNTIKGERVDAFEKAQKFTQLKVESLQYRIALMDGQQQELLQDNKNLVYAYENRIKELNCALEIVYTDNEELHHAIHHNLSEKVKTSGKLGRKLNQSVLKAHQQVTESEKSVHLLVKKVEHLRQLIMKQQMYIIDLEKAFLDKDDWRINAYHRHLDRAHEIIKHDVAEGHDVDDIEEKVPKWTPATLPRIMTEGDESEVRFANISEVLGQDSLLSEEQSPVTNEAVTFHIHGEAEFNNKRYLIPPRRTPFYTPWKHISYLDHLEGEASRPRKVYEEPEEPDYTQPEQQYYQEVGEEDAERLNMHMRNRMNQYKECVVDDGVWPTSRDYENEY